MAEVRTDTYDPPKIAKGSSTAGLPSNCALDTLTPNVLRPPIKHDISALAEVAGMAPDAAHILVTKGVLALQASAPAELAGEVVPIGHAVHPDIVLK
jgi:hypothetical protein